MSEVVDLFLGASRVTTIGHENPDGDTLGAALALAVAAERLGKTAEVVCADPSPAFLDFLPGIGRVKQGPTLEPDLAVVVDAAELSRTGAVAVEHADWLERARIVNIDHHVSNPGFGVAQLVDPQAAATCELVALLLPELGVELDAELATLLMTGIVQDTHTFAHPNVTPRTLQVGATLLGAGAPLSRINRAVYADKPYTTLALWGLMLAGMQQRCDERILYSSMTLEMLAATGEEPTASEGFIDLLASSKRGDVAVVFKEVDPTTTRVSVRTSDRADAVAITSAFGGGGHARAAGCTLTVGIDAARELVLAECEREIDRADARGR